MAGAVTGVGTTFGLPNYHGELIALSPTDTPLLSASGGLNGAEVTDSTTLEWSSYDLRDAASRARLEGADAPTAEERVRGVVTNTVQIFQEAVSTSYTKAATSGMYRTPTSAPFNSTDGQPNPVMDEHAWQVELALKQIARDANWCMWNGVRVNPTTNSTARAMGGLLEACTTNAYIKKAKVSAGSASTDTITVTHDLVASEGDKVVFTDVGASTTIFAGRSYWVTSNSTTASFKVATTRGGTAITVGTATVAFYPLKAANTITVDHINADLLQPAFDNGGISDSLAGIIFVPSGQKRRLTAAYAAAYGQADATQGTRNVGGLAVDTVVSDFGTLGVAIERALPHDALAFVSMEQVKPGFLNIPGKGLLFEEELAKTGASNKSQIYGEIGLKYGNEAAHSIVRGFYA